MTPTNLDYIRAHQFLYYVLARPVLTDHEYDVFGRDSGEDYKGGSDIPASYPFHQKALAYDILEGRVSPLPVPEEITLHKSDFKVPTPPAFGDIGFGGTMTKFAHYP